MKVWELQQVVQQLREDLSSRQPLQAPDKSPGWYSTSLQQLVQQKKAEHHRREAGSSIVRTIEAQVAALRAPRDDCSLQVLRRHACCLALVLSWVDSTQAALIASSHHTTPLPLSPHYSHLKDDFVQLFRALISLLIVDLRILLMLSKRAERGGRSVFCSVEAKEILSANENEDLMGSVSKSKDMNDDNNDDDVDSDNNFKWYRDEFECGIQIAFLLPCALLCPTTPDISNYCAETPSIWAKMLHQLSVPKELHIEIRALNCLLETYTGTKALTQIDLSFSELVTRTDGDQSATTPLCLSSHEDILLLRTATAAQLSHASKQQPSHSSHLSSDLADAVRGGGEVFASSSFSINCEGEIPKGEMTSFCFPHIPISQQNFPRYNGAVITGSESNISPQNRVDDWPIARDFSKILISILRRLNGQQQHPLDDTQYQCSSRHAPTSMLSLLLMWRWTIFPCNGDDMATIENFLDCKTKSSPAQNLGEGGDSEMSTTILQLQRIADNIENNESNHVGAPSCPPAVIPRAVLVLLSAHSKTVSEKVGGDRGESVHFPLQSGAIVFVVNTCCDLIGVSYQSMRQVEYLTALLQSLHFTSSAVLTELAAWAFPKFMQILDVVTDATAKYIGSRCIQILISSIPQGNIDQAIVTRNGRESSSTSQLRIRFAHQLILHHCRDLHLHPSESVTENTLLALQPFIFLCPLGVLMAEVQPISDMLGAILGANMTTLMEAIGNILQLCNNADEPEPTCHLLRGEMKSFRIIMYSIRIVCLMCRRCPSQMRAQYRTILPVTLQLYMVLCPLHPRFKTNSEIDVTGSKPGKPTMIPLIDGEKSCQKYCQWLWLCVCNACRTVRSTLPSEWNLVIKSIAKD